MAMVEAALKSSSISPFQRGKFRSRTLIPLWKRGEGEIFGRSEGDLCRELLGQDTRNILHRKRRSAGDGKNLTGGTFGNMCQSFREWNHAYVQTQRSTHCGHSHSGRFSRPVSASRRVN